MIKGFLLIIALIAIVFSLIFSVQSDNSRQPSTEQQIENPPGAIVAPGYQALTFTPPEPASYRLPLLGKAEDGEVLDSNGSNLSLYDLFNQKIVVLSFIYSTCRDINGCPLATTVLHQIKTKLTDRPDLAKKLRLITMSFDYDRDTPETMRHYGQAFSNGKLDWRFLTTNSETHLQKILKAYNQPVQKNIDGTGKFTGTFSHLLRVYLIDRKKVIRNIYSVSFLHAETLINDIQNLLITESKPREKVKFGQHRQDPDRKIANLNGSGDNKNGYESLHYQTRSKALRNRQGQEMDLIGLIKRPPLGLPPAKISEDNPSTNAKIKLGRRLFYDRRLSLNNTFSCAMCHIPEQGFTSNEHKTATGIEGRSIRRNSPTLYNVGYAERLFHDGRESTLEQQVWGPLLARNEMGNPSIGSVIDKIKNIPEYPELFMEAFDKGPNMETIGMAIANYERTLNSANSPFDRWKYGKSTSAMSLKAQRGFELFIGKAGCAACHTIGQDFSLFTDNRLHNTGLGYSDSLGKDREFRQIQLAPGVFVRLDTETIKSVSEKKPNDLGLYEITQNPNDRWKYKTPNLRNVALTSPYMHNGIFSTLDEIVDFYNRGGMDNETLDPLISPLGLSLDERKNIVAFLEALTGDNVELLVSDAFAAPIGDSH